MSQNLRRSYISPHLRWWCNSNLLSFTHNLLSSTGSPQSSTRNLPWFINLLSFIVPCRSFMRLFALRRFTIARSRSSDSISRLAIITITGVTVIGEFLGRNRPLTEPACDEGASGPFCFPRFL